CSFAILNPDSDFAVPANQPSAQVAPRCEVRFVRVPPPGSRSCSWLTTLQALQPPRSGGGTLAFCRRLEKRSARRESSAGIARRSPARARPPRTFSGLRAYLRCGTSNGGGV